MPANLPVNCNQGGLEANQLPVACSEQGGAFCRPVYFFGILC